MKTKLKNFISRHDIYVHWYKLLLHSVGLTFTQYDSSLVCSGYNYALHVRLWKNELVFTFNTFR